MKIDKTRIKKIMAVVLCTFILTGSISAGAATQSYSADNSVQLSESVDADENQESDKSTDNADIAKDETVYVLAKSDGSVDKIIVSDWLKNSSGSNSITDKSELSDIKNVKGDEEGKTSADGVVWDAKGNDIYYQGNIKKTLPVDMSVSYKLDGKDISASEIAGKSGKVTIRFDYKNNVKKTVKVGDKEQEMYVPFAMLTGVLLDSDSFRNVEVSNGKLINDGDHTAVVGFAMPGLQDNLALDKEKIDIPDYVEITADVTEFELTNTVTVAVNDIFSNLDTSKLDDTDDISSALDEMTDAMSQLTDGSSKLYDGLCTLLEKSGDLISGIDTLASGAKELNDGAGKLADGAGQLSSGANDLATGLETIVSNNDALNAGAKQVFDTLLSTAQTQLKAAGLDVPQLTIDNYNTVLDEVIKSLDKTAVTKMAEEKAKQTVTEKVTSQKSEITKAVTEKVREGVAPKVEAAVYDNVFTQVLAATGMTKEQYDAGVKAGLITKDQQAQLKAATDQQYNTDAVKAIIKQKTDEQMGTADIKKMIAAKTEEQAELLIEQALQSDEVKTTIATAIATAEAGQQSVIQLKEQMNSYSEFYNGLATYTAGVQTAKDGADKLSVATKTLKTGADALSDGSKKLYDGILTLKNGAPALVDGITQLRDGAMQLNDGLNEFNEKAVNKLVSAAEGDIAGLINRVKATAEAAKSYNSFSGIGDNMDGQVKFIYRTDDICK